MTNLGRVAAFFSESVLAGFVTGLALTIAIKQVPKQFGFEGGQGNFWERLYDILIRAGAKTPVALIVCAVLTASEVLRATESYSTQLS